MLERLQKIIARAGIASRRHAEQLILSGQVRVNGSVITELGTKADAQQDRIEAAGKLIEANERRVYIILNKPPEVVSTLADPEGRKTLRNCLKGLPERVYPVGRLDYNASGLVFLTNDGDLTAEMLKDWANLQQSYHVKIKGRLMMDDLDRLGRNASATIRVVRQPDATRGHATNFWYEVTLEDSKKDILRRVLFAENHPVEKLKRIAIGTLNLEGLPQGRYRLLIEKEIEELRRALKVKPKPRYYPTVAAKESELQATSSAPVFAPRAIHHRPAANNFKNGNKFRDLGKARNAHSRPSSNNVRSANKVRVLEEDDATSNSRGPKRFGGPPKFANSGHRSGSKSFGSNPERPERTRTPGKFGRLNQFGRADNFKNMNRPATSNQGSAPNNFGRPNKYKNSGQSGVSDQGTPQNKFGRPNKFAGANRPGNRNRSGGPNRPAPGKPFRPPRDKRS